MNSRREARVNGPESRWKSGGVIIIDPAEANNKEVIDTLYCQAGLLLFLSRFSVTTLHY